MKKINITWRMALILPGFIVPMLVSMWFLTVALNKQITFTETEIVGTQFQKPLLQLLNEIADYQLALSLADAGDKDSAAEAQVMAAAIAEYFISVNRSERDLKDFLNLRAEQVQKGGFTLMDIQQAFNVGQYSAALTKIVDMIKYVGDQSNMILDPELDSYYLVDVVLNGLPPALVELAVIKNSYSALLLNPDYQLSVAQKNQLAIDHYVLQKVALPRIQTSIKESLNADAAFNGINPGMAQKLQAALADYVSAIPATFAVIDRLQNNQPLTSSDFVTQLDVLHDGTAELGDSVIAELDKLLVIRLERLKQERLFVVGSCLLLMSLGLVYFVFVTRGIVRPVQQLTQNMVAMAADDLSVNIANTSRGDELGSMARALLVFRDKINEADKLRKAQEETRRQAELAKQQALQNFAREFEGSVDSIISNVTHAATEMQNYAEKLNATAMQTSERAIAAAVASSQSSQSVCTVTSSAEQLSASIKEISRQVSQSTSVAQNAVHEMSKANDVMQSMEDASQKIGAVLSLITEIAEQTNLLALNATIEAARAGEAGKGFAVVASEVKTLANQTTKATGEISGHISIVQNITTNVQQAMRSVGGTIQSIDGISTAIAGAVEQQSSATQEISRTIQQVSAGTGDVSHNIEAVKMSATATGTISQNILDATHILREQTSRLRDASDSFINRLRSA